MKLYLSSYRIPTPEDFFGLLHQEPEDVRLGLIVNAKDHRENRERKLQEFAEYAAELGITNVTQVDLMDYQGGNNLEPELSRYNALWAIGGNTFDLWFAMKESGFDRAIRKLLKRGIVYGGDSAGAIVAGSTMEGFDSIDDPANNPVRDVSGLGLVEGVIIPHADNPQYNHRLEPMIELHAGNPQHLLNDNQALIVDGAKLRKVTAQ